MPGRLWNCDETGLSYVVKPNKVVTAIGKRYVYKRTYADRGETHTLLGCVCANGSWIPPLIIFKGVRWNDNLKAGCLPNCMVKLSPKGWINSDLFLEWFKFFIDSIPSERPVILFMDSHASHINMDVILLAKENEIYLFTFPAHTSHLLQSLDVGIYKPLNGICPLNKNAILPEAIAPPQLTNREIQSTEIQPHSNTAIQATYVKKKPCDLSKVRQVQVKWNKRVTNNMLTKNII
nr:MFS-type transporter clz9-like [Hydra vulgaris]